MRLLTYTFVFSILILSCFSLPLRAEETLSLFDPDFGKKLFADDIRREQIRQKRLEDDRVTKEITNRLNSYGQYEGYEYFNPSTEQQFKSDWEFYEDSR